MAGSNRRITLAKTARIYEVGQVFVITPVRFKGATGSPGRPIAVR